MENGTIFDSAFRTMINDSDKLTISLINELFGMHISMTSKLIRHQNEVFLADKKERITDSHMSVQGDEHYYHIECESVAGNSEILFRLFEYDSSIALEHAEIENGKLYIRFPMTGILYLRDTKSTPEQMQMIIETQGSETPLTVDVAVMKMSNYTLDLIFEKKLWFLLPFFIFNYEKRLKSKTEERFKEIEKEVLEALRRIKSQLNQLNRNGDIDAYERCMLENMIVRVVSFLAEKSTIIKKGVNRIMGGIVLDYEAKTIRNEGIAEGREEGRIEERKELLSELVQRGVLSSTQADMIRSERELQAKS